MTQSIEIDCPPFTPRPSEYIGGVLKDTGFTEDDFQTGAPFFGCQTWILKDPRREEDYIGVKPIIKARIEALYHAGRIRYGSW